MPFYIHMRDGQKVPAVIIYSSNGYVYTMMAVSISSMNVRFSIDHWDMEKQLTQYNWSYVCLTKDV